MSLLSPLGPALRNGKQLIELLGNALTFERVLHRPTPSHLWTTSGRYDLNSQLELELIQTQMAQKPMLRAEVI